VLEKRKAKRIEQPRCPKAKGRWFGKYGPPACAMKRGKWGQAKQQEAKTTQ